MTDQTLTLEAAITAARTVSNLMGGRLNAKDAEAATATILAAAGSEGAALRALARAFPEVLGGQDEVIDRTAQLLDQGSWVIVVADPLTGTEDLLDLADFTGHLLRGELNAVTLMQGGAETSIEGVWDVSPWNKLGTEFLPVDAAPQDWLPMCPNPPAGSIVLPPGAGYAEAAAGNYNNQVLDLIAAEVDRLDFDTPGADAMLWRWVGMLSSPVHGVDDSYRTQLRSRIEGVLNTL